MAELEAPADEDGAEAEAQYEIIYTPWDALMEGDIADWKKLSAKEVATLQANISWTDELHARMEKRIPMSKLLKRSKS